MKLCSGCYTMGKGTAQPNGSGEVAIKAKIFEYMLPKQHLLLEFGGDGLI